jgi:KUP system potassium uptake protein
MTDPSIPGAAAAEPDGRSASRSDAAEGAAPARPVSTASQQPPDPQAPGKRRAASRGVALAALAALGVVFGDIGTSPLYALKTVFTIDNGVVRANESDVYGVVSLMFWSITAIVSIKYLALLMRADNDGEGGVMALAALAQRLYKHAGRGAGGLIVVGIVGVALFYGDSIITPAVSVLSAVEGVEVAAPGIASLIVPISAVILTVLFAAQRYGTGKVGNLFGPVMVLWFLVLALAGLSQVVHRPAVLLGLSPTYAVAFVFMHPAVAFVAMGAVVLVITGAEALYADMGHFGRSPIRRAWFFLVFPALTLNYLGQGALVLQDPASKANPFFLLFPDWLRLPVVVLATVATIIASQAVISGAFSLTRQAVQLGLLPPLTIRQTSKHESGQIYLPVVNGLLFLGVLAIMLAFGSSARLATAYGVSVTGALVVDTVLMLIVAPLLWHWRWWKIVLAAVVFGGLEVTFLSGNLSKIATGGWVPLLIAAAVLLVMTTWRHGRQIVTDDRRRKEGSLAEFVESVQVERLPRVPGIAVFPHPNMDSTPLALRANVEHNHVLHQRVIIVSVTVLRIPYVPASRSFTLDDLGYTDDGISHLSIRFGFSEEPDVPAALRAARRAGLLDITAEELARASYFISRGALQMSRKPKMMRWRRALFVTLAHNAADPAARFRLPSTRTVTMGSDVEI